MFCAKEGLDPEIEWLLIDLIIGSLQVRFHSTAPRDVKIIEEHYVYTPIPY
jgi:hypothetical protein